MKWNLKLTWRELRSELWSEHEVNREVKMKWIEKWNVKWTWSELRSELWSEYEVNCEVNCEVNMRWIVKWNLKWTWSELRNEMWSEHEVNWEMKCEVNMKQTTWIKQTEKVIAKKHEHLFSSWHPRALALVAQLILWPQERALEPLE